VATVSERAVQAWWIYVLAAGISSYCVLKVRTAIRLGTIAVRLAKYDRGSDPLGFWLMIGLYVFLGAGAAVSAVSIALS
jgi:hypothetical protein